MRNLKRALSLALASVMVLGLMIVGSSAKTADFKDADSINEDYEEAIDVLTTIGLLDQNGTGDGSFEPQGHFTRAMAAKIIATMMLGAESADKLPANKDIFKDIDAATAAWASGYITYCANNGFIAGDGSGNFNPGADLTGVQLGKLLLVALGYDAKVEGYVDSSSWAVNVASAMVSAGIDVDGITFSDPITREQAAQMILNTIKTPMVEYTNRTEVSVNGANVVVGGTEARYVTTTNARENNISEKTLTSKDYNHESGFLIEFGEKYFTDLKQDEFASDEFERPSRIWTWKNEEIGEYLRTDLLVSEDYTTGVSGRTVFDLLGKTIIDEAAASKQLESYVDGGTGYVVKDLLVRTNTDNLPGTGRGVLTQVFLDTDYRYGNTTKVVITSVNTYLAKASADYSTSKENAPLRVYDAYDKAPTAYTAELNIVPNVVDVTKDSFYLVRISHKNDTSTNTDGEIVTILNPEIKEDSTVTKFSRRLSGETVVAVVDKLTINGEEEKYGAAKAFYDSDTLDQYDEGLLTDKTYNIYFDQYGYIIGVSLYDGVKNYVFITGYDRPRSNLSIKTAEATGIFLDGSMEAMTVNVTDTNKNIVDFYSKGKTTNKDANSAEYYYDEWADNNGKDNKAGTTIDGNPALNRWYTYTQNESGVYTLKPVNMTASLYDKETVIKTGNVSILDNGTTDPILKNSSKVDTGVRAYGEDDSVYLTVSLDDVDTTLQNQFGTRAITDVSGIYTGVQNVELTVEPSDYETNTKLEAHVYTAYDNNYYIIGAVVLAEAVGNTKNYAYVLGSVKSEEKIGDTYYWDFDAIVDGNVENLTLKSKYNTYKEYIYAGNVVDLRYDTDGYVIKIKAPQNVYGYTLAENAVATDGYNVYWIKSADAATLKGTLYLELEGRTLYITGIDNGKPVDGGLATAANARAFVIQYENGNKKVRTEYDSVADAFAHLEDPKLSTDSKEFNGVIAAVLNTNGSAAWIVFDRTIKTSNSSDNKPVPPVQDLVIDEKSGKVSVKYDSKGDKPSLNDVIDAITAWLEENRDMHDIEVVNDAGTYKFSGVDSHGYPMSGFEWNPSSDLASIDYVNLIIDDKVVESVPSGDPFTKLDISKYAKTGTSYKWTYGSDSDFYSITQKLSGMGRKNDVVIKTGYVEVNDTTNAATITPKPEDNKAKTKQYVKAGEVKFEFEADGTAYEIVYGEKTSVFYPVEKKNSITVNATGNITISESATVESITDTVKNIAEDKYGEEYKKDAYTINVDFEEKTVDIDILEGHSTSELKDTGLIVFAKQLLEKYDIIVCPDDGKGDITFKKGTDLTDTNNVATLKGLLPDAGRSKNITVKVTKNGDKSVSVDYIVSISVPSAV